MTARSHRDAEAGSDRDLVAVEVERGPQGLHHAGRHPLGFPHAADRTQQDAELVRAETAHGVGGARGAQQALSDLAEQEVARRVAEALVHHLEPVEVEQDQGDPSGHPAMAAAVAGRRLQLLGERIQQHRPVGQAGQLVVQRRVGAAADLCLGTLEEAGVVQRDRSQLPEPGECLDLALRERACCIAGRQADDTQDLAGRGQWHGAHGPERVGLQVRRPGRVARVVVHHHGPPGGDHGPADPRARRQPVAVEVRRRRRSRRERRARVRRRPTPDSRAGRGTRASRRPGSPPAPRSPRAAHGAPGAPAA